MGKTSAVYVDLLSSLREPDVWQARFACLLDACGFPPKIKVSIRGGISFGGETRAASSLPLKKKGFYSGRHPFWRGNQGCFFSPPQEKMVSIRGGIPFGGETRAVSVDLPSSLREPDFRLPDFHAQSFE